MVWGKDSKFPLTEAEGGKGIQGVHLLSSLSCSAYSTVTDLARLRGWSTSVPFRTAT